MSLEMKIFLTSATVTLLGFLAVQFTENPRSIASYASAVVMLAGFVGTIVAVLLLIWS